MDTISKPIRTEFKENTISQEEIKSTKNNSEEDNRNINNGSKIDGKTEEICLQGIAIDCESIKPPLNEEKIIKLIIDFSNGDDFSIKIVLKVLK